MNYNKKKQHIPPPPSADGDSAVFFVWIFLYDSVRRSSEKIALEEYKSKTAYNFDKLHTSFAYPTFTLELEHTPFPHYSMDIEIIGCFAYIIRFVVFKITFLVPSSYYSSLIMH